MKIDGRTCQTYSLSHIEVYENTKKDQTLQEHVILTACRKVQDILQHVLRLGSTLKYLQTCFFEPKRMFPFPSFFPFQVEPSLHPEVIFTKSLILKNLPWKKDGSTPYFSMIMVSLRHFISMSSNTTHTKKKVSL